MSLVIFKKLFSGMSDWNISFMDLKEEDFSFIEFLYFLFTICFQFLFS